MDKAEVRIVIKYSCRKGMSPKEIHDDFIKTLLDESPFSTVKKWAAEFRRGRESVEDLLCFYFTRRFVLCLTLCYFVLVFFSPFSIVITSLGEERANLSAFRTSVRFVLVWFCRFSLPLGFWEGLRFVIVAHPGLLSYLFYERSGRHKEATRTTTLSRCSLIMCGRRSLRDIAKQIDAASGSYLTPRILQILPLWTCLFPNLKTNLRGWNFGTSEGDIDAD